MNEIRFPENFVWGAATAAFQIEGAAREDGRAPSIWDTFCRTPGKVYAGHTGDIACDHYHRYADDVALMAELGLRAYRFSVAWPRIQPDGTGPVNPHGLDFYDRLVDTLIERGIDPIVTLYHWDLPQTLEDRGGWLNRDTAAHFAEYASAVYTRLGDRVRTWTTLNEPWCSSYLGYGTGRHAPGQQDPAAAFTAIHHLLLGHGLAAGALRAAGAEVVGITLNPTDVQPADPTSADDAEAVRLVDGMHNRIFLDPLFRGAYPEDVLAHVARYVDPATFLRDEDEKLIATPIELLGINYYAPTYVAWQPGAAGDQMYPGTEDKVHFLPADGPVTDMGWLIEADGLTRLLERLGRDYPGVPLMIMENGAAFADQPCQPAVDGVEVQDQDRISYLDGHLRAAHTAIARGVDLRGYLVWSLLDNFEWAEGYRKRFGIVHVDYLTQRRTPKASARWYQEVIARNGL